MINEEMDREPSRDPRLAEALRRAEPDLAEDAVDWASMRASITARSEVPLARLRVEARSARRPRRGLRRPALALAPLAAAAGVAALFWIASPESPRDGSPRQDAAGLTTLEEAFGHDLSEQEFRTIVSGRSDPEALLLVAAGEG